jgi:hypothetical protein
MWKGVSSAEGIFALKYALVSIALWAPAVAPTSAQFVYENRQVSGRLMRISADLQGSLGTDHGEYPMNVEKERADQSRPRLDLGSLRVNRSFRSYPEWSVLYQSSRISC